MLSINPFFWSLMHTLSGKRRSQNNVDGLCKIESANQQVPCSCLFMIHVRFDFEETVWSSIVVLRHNVSHGCQGVLCGFLGFTIIQGDFLRKRLSSMKNIFRFFVTWSSYVETSVWKIFSRIFSHNDELEPMLWDICLLLRRSVEQQFPQRFVSLALLSW